MLVKNFSESQNLKGHNEEVYIWKIDFWRLYLIPEADNLT